MPQERDGRPKVLATRPGGAWTWSVCCTAQIPKLVTSLDDMLVERIRAEFMEMPGLCLTLEQARLLCGVERMLCQRVLDMLVDTQFLCIKPNGAYARVTDGADHPRRRPAQATTLGTGFRQRSG